MVSIKRACPKIIACDYFINAPPIRISGSVTGQGLTGKEKGVRGMRDEGRGLEEPEGKGEMREQ